MKSIKRKAKSIKRKVMNIRNNILNNISRSCNDEEDNEIVENEVNADNVTNTSDIWKEFQEIECNGNILEEIDVIYIVNEMIEKVERSEIEEDEKNIDPDNK